jgi:hypothetical protein
MSTKIKFGSKQVFLPPGASVRKKVTPQDPNWPFPPPGGPVPPKKKKKRELLNEYDDAPF